MTFQMTGEVVEIPVHNLGVHPREQAGVSVAGGRTDRGEEIHPFVFGLPEGARTATAFGPDSGQRALLAETRFVLEP